MQGLGDNLYQRAVLREVVKTRETYLRTPWPQIYADLQVRCVRPVTRLRTQAKNAARMGRWHTAPSIADRLQWHYVGGRDSIIESLCACAGVRATSLDFSGPPLPGLPVEREPYIVVRPATVRAEWRAESRNPRPEYIARAVDALKGRYRVVSVADLKAGEEWALDPLPYADECYHAGELHLEQLLDLVAGAAAVVGGVGWLVPAAIAYRRPMFLIYGGWGAGNGPARIFDPRMDTSLIHQAVPDRFCPCNNAAHKCEKNISDLDGHLEQFAIRLDAQRSTAVAA